MKTTTRKIEITAEKSERIYFRQRERVFAVCGECGQRVEMLSPEDAAQVRNITLREIYRMIELGQIHFSENDNDQLTICQKSVLERSLRNE